MLISIDLGYGYTKAVAHDKQISFPSIVAQDNISDLDIGFGARFNYSVSIRTVNGNVKNFLVGEAAQKTEAPIMSKNREKFFTEYSAVFALTAAYLVNGKGQVSVALGLPIAYYKNQKEKLQAFFKSISGYVSVNKQPERYISFTNVFVFPQAGGALYTVNKLPEKGYAGIIDVGFHTTDFLLIECNPDRIMPIKDYSSSIEIGASTAIEKYQALYLNKTGIPTTLSVAYELWMLNKEHELKELAKKQVEQAIEDAILNKWQKIKNLIEQVYLAGGGAYEFEFSKLNAQKLSSPEYANALGFYKLAQKKLELKSINY